LTRGNKIRGKQNTHYNCDGDELIAAVSLGGADVALLDVLQHCAAEHQQHTKCPALSKQDSHYREKC